MALPRLRCCTPLQPALRRDFFLCFILFSIYVVTLHIGPGGRIAPGDAAKFQYVPLILGVPHAPGFPLYILLLRLWSCPNPFFSPATFANLFSALCAAVAAPLFRRALTAVGVSLYPSLLATLALFLTPRCWMAATQAGPNAFALLLVSAILYAVASFCSLPSLNAFAAALFLTLVAAAHDTLLLWWSPFVLTFLLFHAKGLRRSRLAWLAFAAGLLLGPASHAYTYIRSWQLAPALEYVGPRTSLARLFAFALGAQFWPNYGFLSWRAMMTERLPLLARDLSAQLSFCFLGLALPGFLITWFTSPRLALLLSSALIVNLAFSLHQFSPDPPASFWLASFACAFCAAVTLDALLSFASRLRLCMLLLCTLCLLTHVLFSLRSLQAAAADYRWRDLLLAAPPHAVVLTKDVYTTSQLLAYFYYTDRFIRRRALSACDVVTPATTNTLVFLEPPVYDEVRAAGLTATLLTSNRHGALFMLSNASP